MHEYFYRNSKSAINMVNNGKASCGDKSWHIHIRYFNIQDIMNREQMEIKHCPADYIIADFQEKNIKGKHYYKLRQLIMRHGTIRAEKDVGVNDKSSTKRGTNTCVNKSWVKEFTKSGFNVSHDFKSEEMEINNQNVQTHKFEKLRGLTNC